MGAKSRWLAATLVIGAAVFYQQILHRLIFTVAGVGRVMQPLSDFPYTCRRIHHEKLEACEDLWLDHENRRLYLICAGMKARTATRFDTGKLNASALPSGAGWISVMNIDKPGADGLYGLHSLDKGGFRGYRGDGTINPNGFGVEKVDSKTLRFFVTDLEPVLDPETKSPIAEVSVEKRTSIQVFRHERGSKDMQFEYELAGNAIRLPNRVAVLDDGNVMVTNDHSHAGGILRHLELLLGGGTLTYCTTSTTPKRCHVAIPRGRGLSMPNGIQTGPDGLVYLPNCHTGAIHVYQPHAANRSATLVHAFDHNYPVDNFAFDAAGDLWAPGISSMSGVTETMERPYEKSWHTTIWRWSRGKGEGVEWVASKVLEDREREVVAGVTTVEHDVKTGRLFMSGAYTQFMIMCEPR